MATTNANITISSDITTNPITISKSMVMHKFQSNVGLEETTGLQAKKFAATTAVTIVAYTEGTPAKASKVYIRNTGASTTDFFYVGYGEDLGAATIETIGRLYGGNWMLIPWDAVAATTHDIYAKSSTAEPMHIEYMAFIE